MKAGYVYILTNKPNGTLYLGVTSNLQKRVWEHKQKVVEGFSKKYDLDRLVWYEAYDDITDAIVREKQMKKWERSWKLKRIREMNPEWLDLHEAL
ncbi:MAG: GIY-YIG nuclease family protein [Alphaproteobacteria bacterium]|nr:GIY-YIG nuclease family protein [Alphaproteobacteria bacterium]